MRKLGKAGFVFASIFFLISLSVNARNVDPYCDANLGCSKVCHWHHDPDGGYSSYHCECDCEVIK